MFLIDFVVLDMPEDGNMTIIIGRPFLSTVGAIIDCNKGKFTFNVNNKEHMVHFLKKIDKRHGLNSIANIKTVKIEIGNVLYMCITNTKPLWWRQCPLK